MSERITINLARITFKRNERKTINQISQLIIENTDPENQNSDFCKYYTIDEFCQNKINPTNKLSTFHLNIHSLQYHIEDLRILLQSLEHDWDVITISESKLKVNIPPVKDINLSNYQYENTPTAANKGGTLIYVSNKHIYKPRKDLEINDKAKIESTCIEIINTNGKNMIVGCVYKHHNISQEEFNEVMVSLWRKINKENKACHITGDFNMDLLKIEKEKPISDYFYSMTNHNFMPLITLPTRITLSTKTLIDNILYNQFNNEIISGNITVGISDHIPQFSIIPFINNNHTPKNNNIYSRKLKNIDIEKFKNELNNTDWSYTENNETNVNEAAKNFLTKIEQLLDKFAPLRKLNNKAIKQNNKPWITKDILKHIKQKNKLYEKFSKERNTIKKN